MMILNRKVLFLGWNVDSSQLCKNLFQVLETAYWIWTLIVETRLYVLEHWVTVSLNNTCLW